MQAQWRRPAGSAGEEVGGAAGAGAVLDKGRQAVVGAPLGARRGQSSAEWPEQRSRRPGREEGVDASRAEQSRAEARRESSDDGRRVLAALRWPDAPGRGHGSPRPCTPSRRAVQSRNASQRPPRLHRLALLSATPVRPTRTRALPRPRPRPLASPPRAPAAPRPQVARLPAVCAPPRHLSLLNSGRREFSCPRHAAARPCLRTLRG